MPLVNVRKLNKNNVFQFMILYTIKYIHIIITKICIILSNSMMHINCHRIDFKKETMRNINLIFLS